MATYLYPEARELREIGPNLVAAETLNDPLLGRVFPITKVNAPMLQWTLEDDDYGLQQLRGLDGADVHVARIGKSSYVSEPGYFGEFETITERELTMRSGSLVGSATIDISDLVTAAYKQLRKREITRIRQIGWTLLTTGTFSVSGKEGTLTYTDTFALQTYTGSAWNTPGTGTPLLDLRTVQQMGSEYGVGFGSVVIVPRVHPFAGVAWRAEQLKLQIVSQLEQMGRSDEPVIIVAHSMGGLDARYMISKLDMESRVAALLTVTTPHRGSPFADWCVRNLDRRLPVIRAVERLGLDLQACRDLTTDSCRRFNDEIIDSDKVKYLSVSAARPWHLVPAFAYPSHRIIRALEGDNDGLVSVTSSRWGQSLATWPADHWHTINHKMVFEVRNPTGDIRPYYQRAVKQVEKALLLGAP